MFIEFETGSGRTLLNVRHIVQVKRFQDLSDAITEIILANGGVVTVAGSYQDVDWAVEVVPRSGLHNPEDHAALGKGCCLKPLHSTPGMCSVDDIAAAESPAASAGLGWESPTRQQIRAAIFWRVTPPSAR